MSSDLQHEELHVIYKLSKYISGNSQDKIISILKRVKADSKYEKQLVKEENINVLVDLLQFKNIEIVNLTLSLLANMCRFLEIREKVRESKIAAYTLWIIRNLEVSNNLQCRAVRLIGNLSECSCHAKSFCDKDAVTVLRDILHSNTTAEIYIMTVRAIRNIWNSYKKSRFEIQQSGVIARIVTLFVNANAKSYEPKYAGLRKACLKAMCSFAESLDYECAMQMRGETNEEGFKCIGELCYQRNDLAMKCLYNLSQVAECRPTLGGSGIIERLLLLVTNNEELNWQILATLCLFCREAVNRVKIKSTSGLEVMMALLKNDENKKFHTMILDALLLFKYDEDGIAIMVRNGLLEVLIEKLQLMIKAEEVRSKDEKEVCKKRSGDSSPYERTDFKYNRTSSGRFSLDYHYENWSPSSGASTSSSPPSTPPLGLYDCKDIDESAEENYSPVCSDDEWTDKDKEHNINFQEKVKFSVTKHVNRLTLALLSRLSDSNEPMEKLVDPLIISSLTTYIELTKDPKALQILTRIAKNSAYLVPLIQQGFVFEAQSISGSKQCLQQLSAIAETGGAVGQLSSILLCGKEANKTMTAVSIPFLIKSKKILRYLMSNHGGMPLLFRVLADPEHNLHDNAILSINRLANSLDIRPNTIDWNELLIENNIEPLEREKCDVLPKPSVVTFVLDDGATMDACRHTLCEKSEVFSAMLNGKFIEAGKKTMQLKDTSKECLNILLLAADGATFNNQNIEDLLDAVLLANKFLMPEVLEILIKSSISRLNYDNFSRVWNWTRSYSSYFRVCNQLKTFCLESFLISRMTKSERLQAFRDFSSCNDFMQFLEEIKEIIDSNLCQR